MSGFTVHVLESTMDCLNDQESKFLYSVKAREIRRTQHLPLCRFWGLQLFVFADHAAYNYKAGRDIRCRINVFATHTNCKLRNEEFYEVAMKASCCVLS